MHQELWNRTDADSVEAGVYFCPERHGTYFGSFYLKDAPAVGNRDYTIPMPEIPNTDFLFAVP